MKLSVVTTLYKSSRYVGEFHRRISAAAAAVTDDYEVIYVNDGSPDDSSAIVQAIIKDDPRCKLVDLSRNFGHHRAMMCGLHHAVGERVFLTDVDLEEAPENLVPLWRYNDENPDAEVVVASMAARKDSPELSRTMNSWFYLLFNMLSDFKISNSELVSRLMSRAYVDALKQYEERELFFPGVWAHAGFTHHYYPATKLYDGHSTYTFRRKLSLAIDAITSFSSKPLLLIFYMGILFSAGASIVILYLILSKLIFGSAILGWTSLAAIMFLVGGIIMFSLGVVGLYVAKLFTEVKARPNMIIRKIYTQEKRP